MKITREHLIIGGTLVTAAAIAYYFLKKQPSSKEDGLEDAFAKPKNIINASNNIINNIESTKQTLPSGANEKEPGNTKKYFQLLRLHLSVPENWKHEEVPSMPIGTSLRFSREEDEEQAGIVLTVQDLSRNPHATAKNLQEETLKEIFGMTQMMMMQTGGTMPPPDLKQGSCSLGIFTEQLTFGFLGNYTCSYFGVAKEMAYTVQLNGSKEWIETNTDVATAMAKSLEPDKLGPYFETAYISVSGNGISVKTPVSWSVKKKPSPPALLEFSCENVKQEEVRVFKAKDIPEGAKHGSKYSGSLYLVNNDYAVALGKYDEKTSLPREVLEAFFSTIAADNEGIENKKFVNIRDGYELPYTEGAFNFSAISGSAYYIPINLASLQTQTAQEPPEMFEMTIRVGHPDNDPTCSRDLAKWRERLPNEVEGLIDVTDGTCSGLPAIIFTNEEKEGPEAGQAMTIFSKGIIVVRPNEFNVVMRATLPKDKWSKFEAKITSFFNSLKFI